MQGGEKMSKDNQQNSVALKISNADKDEIRKEADRIGVTMSTYIRMAVKEKINKAKERG